MFERRHFLDVRPGERRQTILLTLNVLTIVTAYTMVKNVRDAVFLARFGVSHMALMMIGLAVTAGTLTSVCTRLGHRFSLVRRIALTHVVIAVSLIALWIGFAVRLPGMAWVLYVWSSFFGLFVLANFWLLANELHDTRSAKRLFAILGAGAISGGILGGELARFLAPRIGALNLLPIVAAALATSTILAAAAWRVSPRERLPAQAAPHEQPVKLAEGFHLIRRHRHLKLIATMLLLSTVATTLVDMMVKSVAKERYGADSNQMTAFFGRLTELFSIGSLIVQLLVTSRFLKRFGVGAALLALPLSLAVGGVALGMHAVLAIPMLTAAALAKLGDGGVRFSLDKAAMELLYLPVPAVVKAKAKPLIDTVADRAATALTGIAWLTLTWLSTRSGAEPHALIAAFVLALLSVWVYVIGQARGEYLHELRKALVRRHRGPEPALAELAPDIKLRSRPDDLDRLLSAEAHTYARHLAALRGHIDPEQRAALTAAIHEDLERIFRALRVHYPEADVNAAYHGLHSAEPTVRADAVELLDNMMTGRLRRALIPLLERGVSGHE